jgi:hypothetical protein
MKDFGNQLQNYAQGTNTNKCQHPINMIDGNDVCQACGTQLTIKAPVNKDAIIAAQAETIRQLREALGYYADERRYKGANQSELIEGDKFQPTDCPYLWSVDRDYGEIARKVLTETQEPK